MRAIDVSRWQGDIDWAKVQAPIAIIKASGGDDGLYYDSKCTRNYAGAKAAGKAVGLYHFAGGGNAVEEADFFIRACSPLEPNDVLVLDWEIRHADPVGWCSAFIDRIVAQTGVRCLIYMNSNTASTIDWQGVVDRNIGLWVAHYGLGPDDLVPVGKFPTYVMHQYSSTGREPGVGGGTANVDVNEWFGTVDQFKKYGFRAVIQDVTPPPAPVPPAPAPAPTPVPTPAPGTVIPPTPADAPIVVDPTNPPDSPVEVLPAKRPFNVPAILVRSISTFGITFFTFVLTNVTDVTNTDSLKILAISAVAAGVAAVKNLIVQPQEAK